jgi:2-hydroxychromene-2-carboxylate isomerase
MNAIPYRWPRPDPIIQSGGEIPAEQSYIYLVTRMGAGASRAGKGFAFAKAAAFKIWSGTVDNWHEGAHLAEAAREAGLDGPALEREAKADAAALDAQIAQNEADQKAAGHWGVPLFAFNGECFFGQDRIDHLLFRLKQQGLTKR